MDNITLTTQVLALHSYNKTTLNYSKVLNYAERSEAKVREYLQRIIESMESKHEQLPKRPTSDLSGRVEDLRKAYDAKREDMGFCSFPSYEDCQEDRRQIIIDAIHDLPESFRPETIEFDELDQDQFQFASVFVFGKVCGALGLWPPTIQEFHDLAPAFDKLVDVAIDAMEGIMGDTALMTQENQESYGPAKVPGDDDRLLEDLTETMGTVTVMIRQTNLNHQPHHVGPTP
ncbi:hypothetical protein B0I35DRAFT_445073 [Stachybotrys elegans]|uniref:Uncharacterized protein n=1 Tax=Stachybotrys elegans TaxID=80388 RepID=A0A8K0SAA5_9HYPO|nr:hypothetical protein B0I35DRAFT_445073 [Stachybotrys elegans]